MCSQVILGMKQEVSTAEVAAHLRSFIEPFDTPVTEDG